MPVTAGEAALTPRRTRALCVMNSGLMYSISATSRASSCTSSGRRRIRRPSPKPANGRVVRPPRRLAGAGADRDEARVVAMGDEPLRDVEHAVPARDDHLRIGRVAGAERGTRHLGEDDLDREDRRLLLLVRFEPDLVEPALH